MQVKQKTPFEELKVLLVAETNLWQVEQLLREERAGQRFLYFLVTRVLICVLPGTLPAAPCSLQEATKGRVESQGLCYVGEPSSAVQGSAISTNSIGKSLESGLDSSGGKLFSSANLIFLE